ncbi:MAG: low specificity L-threonine aldolase [Bacteroidales bacterium]|nr:low specificity L-threonine aldolase [Bacteroidales bacterium]
MNKRGFASDNNAGVHPEIMKAIESVNTGHTIAYGDDPYTASAVTKIKSILGDHVDPFFVFIGTAANVLGLDAVTKPYHSIICTETSHIHEDECGAPERWTGCKLLSVESPDGKLSPASIEKYMYGFGFEHHSQPRVISITQSTEMGTVYSIDEIRSITTYAHDHNMLVHMDGARISNAAASLQTGFKSFTVDAGIDVLSFGGTKNGIMYGEAVVFINKEHAFDFKYLRKQGMQLASKMRFIAAQFERFLDEDVWLKNASHANRMAKLLEAEVMKIDGIQITQPVQSNAVFAILPKEIIPVLQKEFFFYVWNEAAGEVRWMCSYDTTEEDVINFSSLIRKVMN